jgi:hypothetical protein
MLLSRLWKRPYLRSTAPGVLHVGISAPQKGRANAPLSDPVHSIHERKEADGHITFPFEQAYSSKQLSIPETWRSAPKPQEVCFQAQQELFFRAGIPESSGEASPSGGSPSAAEADSESLQSWRRRQELVLLSILNFHLQQRDFAPALSWLHALLRQRAKDPHVWAMLGCVRLQVRGQGALRLPSAEHMYSLFSPFRCAEFQRMDPTSGERHRALERRGSEHRCLETSTGASLLPSHGKSETLGTSKSI